MSISRHPGRMLLAGLASLALASCSLLAPRPDPSRFYLLTAIPDRETSAAGPAIALGVGPISFPGYLDRPEVVIRTGPNQVALSETDRWAEPLKGGFQRVLSDNLGELLNSERILQFPWYRDVRVDYQVHASVQRFDTDQTGHAVLVVRWGIKRGDGETYLGARETRYESLAQGPDPAANAGALSETLAEFSRDVARAVSRAEGSEEVSAAGR